VRRHFLSTPAVVVAAVLGTSSIALAGHAGGGNRPLDSHRVGRQGGGVVLTPQNQFVTPAGVTIEQQGQPMDMQVSPDGKTAVDLTKSQDTPGEFTVVDLVAHRVLQQYTPPAGLGSGDVSSVGLLYSPDGRTLWASQSGDIMKFAVGKSGTLSHPQVIALPPSADVPPPTDAGGGTAQPLPSDLAWAADGRHIVVVLNGWNTIAELDAATGTLGRQTRVGVAPRDVVLINGHAYVGNEGGRQPTATDFTGTPKSWKVKPTASSTHPSATSPPNPTSLH